MGRNEDKAMIRDVEYLVRRESSHRSELLFYLAYAASLPSKPAGT